MVAAGGGFWYDEENGKGDGDMKLSVNEKRCIGCGMCAAAVPEVFRIVGGVSTVAGQPAAERIFRVLDAANGCPVNAITAERDG